MLFDPNPLVEVAFEVRFPIVLKIEAESPVSFQESIRKEYPRYERATGILGQLPKIIPDELKGLLDSFGGALPGTRVIHKFVSNDRKRTIQLGTRPQQEHSFLAVSVHDYTRWEEFKPLISRLTQALEQSYFPSDYTRIGLRYIDKIESEKLGLKDKSWKDLLEPTVAGIISFENMADHVIKAQSVTIIDLGKEIEDAKMQVRGSYEMSPPSVSMDIDCFIEGQINSQDSEKYYDKFNSISGRFFRWSLSDTAKSAFGGIAI